MRIGVIGSGMVGQTLADGFARKGHEVRIGTRDATRLAEWSKTHPGVSVGDPAAVAAFAEIVVLAVKGTAAVEAVRALGRENLGGRIVIDATNPIADAPPQDGVLSFFTTFDRSLFEQLQQAVPDARFVKAFNSVGAALMVDPRLQGGRPTMFICGNDEGAKRTVTGILDSFGWDAEDVGGAAGARAIEPLCMLWCIPGFRQNDWMHAFKMLRP